MGLNVKKNIFIFFETQVLFMVIHGNMVVKLFFGVFVTLKKNQNTPNASFFFFWPFTSDLADSMSIIIKTTTSWVIKKNES